MKKTSIIILTILICVFSSLLVSADYQSYQKPTIGYTNQTNKAGTIGGVRTDAIGMGFRTNNITNGFIVTKFTNLDVNVSYLYNSNFDTLLDSSTFIGENSTFYYNLTPGVMYNILVQKPGSFTEYYATVNMPFNTTNIFWINYTRIGVDKGLAYAMGIYSITTAENVSFASYTEQTTNNNSDIFQNNTIIINTTTYKANTIIHRLYNSTGSALNITNSTTNNYKTTYSNIPPGVYYFNATINDSSYTVTLETRKINVYGALTNLTYPINNTIIYTNPQININFSIFNGNINRTIIYLYNETNALSIVTNYTNQTNITYLNFSYTVPSSLSDGTYYIWVETYNNNQENTSSNVINITIDNKKTFNIIDGYGLRLNYSNTFLNDTTNNKVYNSSSGIIILNITSINTNIRIWTVGLPTQILNLSFSNLINEYNVTLLANISITITSTNCGILSTAINFSMKDEDNATSVNGTIDYNFQYGLTNGTAENVSGRLTNVNTLNICINATLYTNWTVGSGEIQYVGDSSVSRRYYIFNNSKITNNTRYITLYNLKSSSQTSFNLVVESSSLEVLNNKYVSLIRWYPSTNSYSVVDMGKTDDKGETVIHVKTEDVDYRVGIYELDGTLIYLANPIRMVCLTTPCVYTLKVQDETFDYTNFLNIQYTLDFNETTGMWLFTYNDPSQTTTTMNLSIYKQTGEREYLICSNSLTAYTGAINCNTSGYSGTLKAVVKRSASPFTTLASMLVEIGSKAFNTSFGLIISLVIAVIVIFVFSFVNPVLAVIGGIISLVPAWYLGVIGWVVVAGFIVMGGLIIYMMRRQI